MDTLKADLERHIAQVQELDLHPNEFSVEDKGKHLQVSLTDADFHLDVIIDSADPTIRATEGGVTYKLLSGNRDGAHYLMDPADIVTFAYQQFYERVPYF